MLQCHWNALLHHSTKGHVPTFEENVNIAIYSITFRACILDQLQPIKGCIHIGETGAPSVMFFLKLVWADTFSIVGYIVTTASNYV